MFLLFLLNGMDTMRPILILHVFFACSTIVFGGTHPDGVSKVSREQDALGNYKFSYDVSNPEGNHFREEGTDEVGRVIGSYGLTHVDGTSRVVDYVADKNGFRAAIRSNEPGVISSEAADAPIEKQHPALPAAITSHAKLHPNLPLTVAESSVDNSASAYGSRLNTDSSPRVTYSKNEENKSLRQEEIEDSAREQRNYEDYRPRNPVAYYPRGAIERARSVRPSDDSSSEDSSRSQQHNPSDETRPSDTYLPPIDPYSAGRRPPYFDPREKTPDRSSYTTTSRRPFIPPYGGFDDDPTSVARRPGIPVSSVHGGAGRDEFESPQTSTPAYGAGRYPSDNAPLSRDFINPIFPPRSNFPPLPRLPGSPLTPLSPPRSVPGPIFGPPSYNTGLSPPNYVLRAVPIPNGVQAVRVDPETGRVYDRLMYPLYLRDGQAVYDQNVLLHNDDISDDTFIRNRDTGYLDMPFRRPPYRSVRNLDLDSEDFGNITRRYNRTFDPLTMSMPTARELEWIRRQIAQVEGFDRSRLSSLPVFQNTRFRNDEYPIFNDFDDASNKNLDIEDRPRPYSRIQNSGQSGASFSRNPRLIDRLTPEDTKNIASKSESLILDMKSAETNPQSSVAVKKLTE